MTKTLQGIGIIVAGMLLAQTHALSQTLAQTAAYIIAGGFVELGDIKEIDQDTVGIPGYMMTFTFAMPPLTLKVVNRQKCEVLTTDLATAKKEVIISFNKVIVQDTTEELLVGNFSKFSLIGEEFVACSFINGVQQTCVRNFPTVAKSESLPRIYNALKYLYSNFCTSARRMSPF